MGGWGRHESDERPDTCSQLPVGLFFGEEPSLVESESTREGRSRYEEK